MNTDSTTRSAWGSKAIAFILPGRLGQPEHERKHVLLRTPDDVLAYCIALVPDGTQIDDLTDIESAKRMIARSLSPNDRYPYDNIAVVDVSLHPKLGGYPSLGNAERWFNMLPSGVLDYYSLLEWCRLLGRTGKIKYYGLDDELLDRGIVFTGAQCTLDAAAYLPEGDPMRERIEARVEYLIEAGEIKDDRK